MNERTLSVLLPEPFLVVSWAPLGGGFRRSRAIVNHQIEKADRRATEAPRAYLRRVTRQLGHNSSCVAMMTGANVAGLGHATLFFGEQIVSAWCTAGCSNALRVGDPATVEDPFPGTINLIVMVNQPLSRPAFIEAIMVATEARVLAMQNAGIVSVRSGEPATGTGTDCVAIAAPIRRRPIPYCGKHTRLGELIGKAVLSGCAGALSRLALK